MKLWNSRPILVDFKTAVVFIFWTWQSTDVKLFSKFSRQKFTDFLDPDIIFIVQVKDNFESNPFGISDRQGYFAFCAFRMARQVGSLF